jgi:hypothetical protein
MAKIEKTFGGNGNLCRVNYSTFHNFFNDCGKIESKNGNW